MSSMTNFGAPRGPLPPRVYWIRRGVVVVLALGLIFGVGRLLSGLGGGNDGQKAVTASQSTSKSPTPSTATGTVSPSASPSAGSSARATPSASPTPRSSKAAAELPASAPQGDCKNEDITVRPSIKTAAGGSRIAIPLVLTTGGKACTWSVSSKNVVVKITSGKDRIWTSQDCPATIPDQSVVVRPVGEKKTLVDVAWSGRRSAEECPRGTDWSSPGSYHVVASSLGGTPTDVQFLLTKPPRPTVTKTATPTPSASGDPGKPGREN